MESCSDAQCSDERHRCTPSLQHSIFVKHRLERVNELLKRELSSLIIARDITFTGCLVTINHVDVTPDLKSAHVFVSVLGSEGKAAVIEKLEAHRAELQSTLARHVRPSKYTPHLVFHLDDSIERGTRVMEILHELEEPDAGEK